MFPVQATKAQKEYSAPHAELKGDIHVDGGPGAARPAGPAREACPCDMHFPLPFSAMEQGLEGACIEKEACTLSNTVCFGVLSDFKVAWPIRGLEVHLHPSLIVQSGTDGLGIGPRLFLTLWTWNRRFF